MAKKYYAYYIISSEKKGICDNWDECKNIVQGEKSRYKSFKTYEEAEEWLLGGAEYIKKEEVKKNLPEGIYFDAGTGRGIGVEVRVVLKDGTPLLEKYLPKEKVNNFGNYLAPKGATNNFGELIGIYFALKIAEKEEIYNIYGDSSLVINYWSKGHIKKDNVAEDTYNLAMKVKTEREKFERRGGQVSHISGDFNPADLGFHK